MLIDVNVSLGHWPFQKFDQDNAAKLSKHLTSEGITTALVSSIETVFHPDPDVYNRLLLRKTEPYPNLVPIMVLNPSLSGWRQRLEEYAAFQKASVIKILPNYHNYSLSSQHASDLMKEMLGRKIALIIQMRLEDERNQYPLLKVAGVSPAEIIKLADGFPEVPIISLCPYYHEAVSLVKATPNIYIDISFVERLNTVAALGEEIPATRILFGSHTPFLYTRSAIMKLKLAEISRKAGDAIMFSNISKLLKLKKYG